MIEFTEGYTFDDFLMAPRYSDCLSRKTLDTSVNLTKNIKLKVPIIASPMDTVCEDKMCISLALLGSLGIVHRYMTIDDQVAMLTKVKRHTTYLIEKPYCIGEDETIGDYHRMANLFGVKSFLVIADQSDVLIGIITSRDATFYDESTEISKAMTPIDKLHCIQIHDINQNMYDIGLSQYYDTMKQHKVEKLPIINSEGRVRGMVTLKDLERNREANNSASVDKLGRLLCGCAVGVQPEDRERIDRLVAAGCDILCIDVAHGHHVLVQQTIEYIRAKHGPIDIMAGNVCTSQGVQFLAEAGANSIRCGIGGSGVCSTRLVTGCGAPQMTALSECITEARKYGVTIISDGGHAGSTGNVCKALAIGATACMLGNRLAATTESPGPVITLNNKQVKIYRGMAGFGANISRRQKALNQENVDIDDYVPEGIESYIEYKGPVKGVVYQIVGGIKSCMSYLGTYSVESMVDSVRWIKVSAASQKESGHHSVNRL